MNAARAQPLSKADKNILDAVLNQKVLCRKKERVSSRTIPPSTSSSSELRTAGNFRERSYLGFMKRRLRMTKPPRHPPPSTAAPDKSGVGRNSRPSFVPKPSTNIVTNFLRGLRRRENAAKTKPVVSDGFSTSTRKSDRSKSSGTKKTDRSRSNTTKPNACDKCSVGKNLSRGEDPQSTSKASRPEGLLAQTLVRKSVSPISGYSFKINSANSKHEEVNESRERLKKFFESFPKENHPQKVSDNETLISSIYFLASEGSLKPKAVIPTKTSNVEVLVDKDSSEVQYYDVDSKVVDMEENVPDGGCFEESYLDDESVDGFFFDVESTQVIHVDNRKDYVGKSLEKKESFEDRYSELAYREVVQDDKKADEMEKMLETSVAGSFHDVEAEVNDDVVERVESKKKLTKEKLDAWRFEMNRRLDSSEESFLTSARGRSISSFEDSRPIEKIYTPVDLTDISDGFEEPQLEASANSELVRKCSTVSSYLGEEYFPKDFPCVKKESRTRDFLPLLADAVSRSSAYLSAVDDRHQKHRTVENVESSSSAQTRPESDISSLGNIFDHLRNCVNLYFSGQAQKTKTKYKANEAETMQDILSYIGSNINTSVSSGGKNQGQGGNYAGCMGLEGMPWLASSNVTSESEDRGGLGTGSCRFYPPPVGLLTAQRGGTDSAEKCRKISAHTLTDIKAFEDVCSSTVRLSDVEKVESLRTLEMNRKISTHSNHEIGHHNGSLEVTEKQENKKTTAQFVPEVCENKPQVQENWHFTDLLPSWSSGPRSTVKETYAFAKVELKNQCDTGCQTEDFLLSDVRVKDRKSSTVRFRPGATNIVLPERRDPSEDGSSSERSSLDIYEEAIERDFYFVEHTDDQLSVDENSSVDRLFGGSWTSWKDGRRKEGRFVALPSYRNYKPSSHLWTKPKERNKPVAASKCANCSKQLNPKADKDTSVRYLFVSEKDKQLEIPQDAESPVNYTGDKGDGGFKMRSWRDESVMDTDFLDDILDEALEEPRKAAKCFVGGREVNVIPWRDTTYGDLSLHQVETLPANKPNLYEERAAAKDSEVKYSVSRYGERDDQTRSFVEIEVLVTDETQFERSTLMKEAPRVVGGLLAKGPTRAARRRLPMRRSDCSVTDKMHRTFTTQYQTPGGRCVVKEVTHYLGDRWMKTTYRTSGTQPTAVTLKLLVYFAQPISAVMGQMRKTSSVFSVGARQRSPGLKS